MKKRMIKIIAALIVLGIAGFCIITNSGGVFRSYRTTDLPFVIQLNQSVPAEWVPVIEDGMAQWNNIDAAYFEFVLGPNSPANSPGLDNINLLYFDQVGDNFDVGTNVIAFSRTFTSNTGGYHAVESDYIYNARDYPPSITGQPNRQDLMSITVHEIGHHLGLDHTGLPSGASSGCGTFVQAATMWYASSAGDTSKRSLHLHDVAGVAAIYPNWVVHGTVTDFDSGLPLSSSEIIFTGTYAAAYSEVENPIGTRYARPGDPFTSVTSELDGSYSVAVLDKNFDLGAERFGYYADTVSLSFSDVTGYGNTEFQEVNFVLHKKPTVTFSGSLNNGISGSGIIADVSVSWVKDAQPFQTLTTNANGQFSFDVFADGYYNLDITFTPPYKLSHHVDSVYVGLGGEVLNLDFNPVAVFALFPDSNASVRTKVITAIENLGKEYASWQINETNGLPSTTLLESFSHPLALLWIGGEETASISTETSDLFITHLMGGNGLFIAGRNLTENADSGDVFIEQYAGIKFADNSSAFKVSGFVDDPIGDSLSSVAPGPGKDVLSESGDNIGYVNGVFYYGTDPGNFDEFAAIRSEDVIQEWKIIYMGFGIEQLLTNNMVDSVITRSINYLLDSNFIVSVENELALNNPLQDYALFQNYPNPFNPTTRIEYGIQNSEFVSLKIYDILGNEVSTLIGEQKPAGKYEVEFSADELSSGVYFYQLKAGSFVQTRKMMLLK